MGVPGAGFYVGDAHAAQADGEFCGGGIEVRAEMTLTLARPKDLGGQEEEEAASQPASQPESSQPSPTSQPNEKDDE